jgi:hypothetical protein
MKLKIDLPYDPAIPLLGMYPKKYKPGYNRATCMLMFYYLQYPSFGNSPDGL